MDDLVISVDEVPSGKVKNSIANGYLRCDSLQLRGHAMFSGAGLPMGSILIEYAWLMEVLIGDVKGLLSVRQVSDFIQFPEQLVKKLKFVGNTARFGIVAI